MPDRIPHCQAFLYCQLTNFISTLKGFAAKPFQKLAVSEGSAFGGC